MTRLEIEHSIRDEAIAVDEVLALLASRAAIETWPESLQFAFLLALSDDVLTAEAWKATALRRHLFGEALMNADVSRPPSALERRLAERLRSDLPARARLRAGLYLVTRARAS